MTAGSSFSRGLPYWIILLLILLWGLILLAGYYIAGPGLVSVLLIPFLAGAAVIIPIFIYVSIVRNQEVLIPDSRGWGAISVGATASPVLGILVEFGIAVIALIIVFVIITQNPLAVSNLERITNRLMSAQTNPEVINNLIATFVHRPVNQYLILAIVSGIIPIIEEIIKQTPAWLLVWRKLTPRAGMVIGALSGAGFALTESLLTTSLISDPDQWLFQTIGRAGTGLMHVTTGAIGGWGLASAFSGRGYLKSMLAYLLAIILHSFWNGMAIWEGIGRLINATSVSSVQFGDKSIVPTLLLGCQFLVMLFFWIINKKILKD